METISTFMKQCALKIKPAYIRIKERIERKKWAVKRERERERSKKAGNVIPQMDIKENHNFCFLSRFYLTLRLLR